MKTLQLFKDGREILGSDGILYVDGRFNRNNIINAVRDRNNRYAKNFPHLIADSFAIYYGRIGGSMSNVTPIN